MGVFNNFPYTNIHELNLDWLIKKVKELDSKVNDDLETIIREYVNTMYLNVTYNEEEKKIILSVE